MDSAIDVPALVVALVVAVALSGALLYAHREGGGTTRRGWITAAGLVVLLTVLSELDRLRGGPYVPKLSIPFIAAIVATIATLGMVRATHRVPPWGRLLLVFATAFVMLLGGVLFAAAYVAPSLLF